MQQAYHKPQFRVSMDSRFQLMGGIIRQQVLADEFRLPEFDFSYDEFDRQDNTVYLLANGHCVGVCRVVARRDAGRLPVEDYVDLETEFGLQSSAQLNTACEFSRLAILPDYQGLRGSVLLVNAALEYARSRGLSSVIYCSTAAKMRAFRSWSRQRDVWLHTSKQRFCYAGAEHLVLHAAMADLNRSYNGEHKTADVA